MLAFRIDAVAFENVLQPIAAFRAVGAKPESFLGSAVAGGGDVNGDGFSDILVSEHPYASPSRVICRYGSSGGIAEGIEQSLVAYESAPYFGAALAVAGDANGDGFADAVISADDPNWGTWTDEGWVSRCAVYYGSSNGLPESPSAWLESPLDAEEFGFDVEFIGDVNGDGVDDVVVGAPGIEDSWWVEGSVSLYLGSTQGIASQPAWVAVDGWNYDKIGYNVSAAGDLNLDGLCDAAFIREGKYTAARVIVFGGTSSGLSAEPIWESSGPTGHDVWFSDAIVAGGGDLDGNGYGDLVVSCPVDEVGSHYGGTLVYLGSAQGMPSDVSVILESHTGGYDNVPGSLCIVPDQNDDGFQELLIGNPSYSGAQDYEGSLACFRGSAAGLAATPTWVIERNRTAGFGGAVANAGDVDGDGRPDLVVGGDQFTIAGKQKMKYAFGEYLVFDRFVETTPFRAGDHLHANLLNPGDAAFGRFFALEGMKLRVELMSTNSGSPIVVSLRDSAGVVHKSKQFEASSGKDEHVFTLDAIGEFVLEIASSSGASVDCEFRTQRILPSTAKPKQFESLVVGDSKTKYESMSIQALPGAQLDIFLTKKQGSGVVLSSLDLEVDSPWTDRIDLVPYTTLDEDGSATILDVPISKANEYRYTFGGWSPKSNRIDCQILVTQPPPGNALVELAVGAQP